MRRRTRLVLPCGLRVVPDQGKHRVEGEGHEQRDQYGGRHHDAELEEEAANDAAHEGDGQEDRDDAEGRGEHREADLVGAVERGLAVRLAEADVAHDVFTHHDGVVDQDADGEADSAIRVSTFSVKPKAASTMKAPNTEIGKARPVITVRAPGMQEQEDDGDGETSRPRSSSPGRC